MFICITFVHALKITKCFILLEITTLIVVKVFAGQLQNIYTSHLFWLNRLSSRWDCHIQWGKNTKSPWAVSNKYGVIIAKVTFQNLNSKCRLGLYYLTPLSTLFQLYRADQFYWWRKPEDPENTTDLPQVTGNFQ